jgi:hypothetical protein
MIRTPRILQKFYIYDPNASDTLGGLRVMEDKNDKGEPDGKGKYVLAVLQQVQYWIDQGLMGEKPVGEIGEGAKKLLAQVTRGRSEDNDVELPRLPRYDRRTQSGATAFAGTPASVQRKKRQNERQKDRQKDRKLDKKHPPNQPQPKTTEAHVPKA